MHVLDDHDVMALLAQLEGWVITEDGSAIEKPYVFDTFADAFAFMTRGAVAAEKLDHHPDWRNVYNRVDVRLTTHDAVRGDDAAAGKGGLTALDFDLAEALDALR